MNNKNNNLKLTALANEFKAAMNHAEKVFNEYMEVALDHVIEEAIGEMSDADKVILLLGLMTGAVEDKIVFDLEKLLSGENKKCPYYKSEKFVKEISRLHKAANDKSEQVPSVSRMPKSFVEKIAALYGDNFVIHIVG